ncbi:hypothetical protein B0J17DRAFT_678505 [Rhizoctonia solani]|nr:hypothetical protein B0J17DRAFT_678505 [Rhizoctonia solani]
MSDSTPNELPNESQALEHLSLLTGVYFDASTGPITASCPAVVSNTPSTERVRAMNESALEDIYPENELDAQNTRLGWPPLSKLPERPWSILTPRDQRPLKTEIWAINISPRDLRHHQTNAPRIKALREVFITWYNVVVGASLVSTGTLNDVTTLPDSSNSPRHSLKENNINLAEVVDQHLGTTRCFARRLETRVQGGSSDTLLTQGYEAWLQSITETTSWRIVRVNHAIPITDILNHQLRDRIDKLFMNSIILRSPAVGELQAFGFDGATNGLRNIERVTIWFSDARIRDISFKYAGGAVNGPYFYGLSNPLSQSDAFVLSCGEYVTDVFVWQHLDVNKCLCIRCVAYLHMDKIVNLQNT